MSGIVDLVTWLRVQLDADERRLRDWVTRRCDGCGCEVASRGAAGLVYCLACRPGLLELEPVEALADIEAKRAIIDAAERSAAWEPHPGLPCTNDEAHGGDPYEPCELHLDAYKHRPPQVDPYVLRLLASAHAGRPGYREEWRPT